MKFPIRKMAAGVLKLLFRAGGIAAVLSVAVLIVAWLLFPFPVERIERWAASPIVWDVNDRDLIGIVGSDDHWRRPVPLEDMSSWLAQATIAVEDERFYSHPGVDPLAVARAAVQNIAARRIVSGASTLNMQLCRMMDNRPRSLKAKIIESFRALQLNRLESKDDILELYLNVAPYGGNLRGAEAASLEYFGRHAKDLSLGQAALIAGLPQSPSRYRPDRRLELALKRRHIVLHRMVEAGMITEFQLEQAQSVPIEIQSRPRQRMATHAAWFALKRRPMGGRTTINLDIQKQVEHLSREHVLRLPGDSELAVVVIDIEESAIVCMVGSGSVADPVDGRINGALAKRSPGSTLKPFVYAAAFEAGRLNGESIVHDIPISRGGWTPANFDRTFSGRITAAEALRRSLNVPAVLVAEAVGLAGCCGMLEAVGVRLPSDAQRRGGLALAVGGIEVRLLDLTNAYATLGRDGIRGRLRIFEDELASCACALAPNVCRAISDILSSRRRRPAGMENALPEDVPWFAWKTGTSTGRRDAWAVGHNRRYAIGVWVGRFRGTGRVAYVGAEAAEPLLAELFDLPTLRTYVDPPVAEPVRVWRPLPPPRELGPNLRITAPSQGDIFICRDDSAVVHTSVNRTEGISWFLNGKLVRDDPVSRFVLTPGEYTLRCVDKKGQSSSVTFSVLSPDIS